MEERILTLNNIGAIKEAQIHLNGLVVMAGENDTGKSTVTKILMALIKAHNIGKNKQKNYGKVSKEREFNTLIKNLFNYELSTNGFAKICEQKDDNEKKLI